jgi:hypothetical protein
VRTRIFAAFLGAMLSLPQHIHSQLPESGLAPLAMKAVDGCAIEMTPLGAYTRWGGVVAVYDLIADEAGAVIALNRRKEMKNVQAYVKLGQFEECVRRWRFGSDGKYAIEFRGGPISGDFWTIVARTESRALRLRVPVARGAIPPPR